MATHYKTSLEPLLKIPKDPGVRPAAIYENSTHVQCNGLQAHVRTCANHIANNFSGVKGVGGFSQRNIAGTRTISDHALGLALDFMVPLSSRYGDNIAEFLKNNAEKLNVKYIIWNGRICSAKNDWVWRAYKHPGGGGGNTLMHRDHVHVSFYGDRDNPIYRKNLFENLLHRGTQIGRGAFALFVPDKFLLDTGDCFILSILNWQREQAVLNSSLEAKRKKEEAQRHAPSFKNQKNKPA